MAHQTTQAATRPPLAAAAVTKIAPLAPLLAVAALAGLAALAAGCRSQPQPIGQTGVQADYGLGTLKAEISPQVSVVAATTAAEIALRQRGYTIESRVGTHDEGLVVARRARAALWESVRVSTYLTPSGTGLSVWVTPVGEEVTSRVVMEAILARLGPGIALPTPEAQPAQAAAPSADAPDQ